MPRENSNDWNRRQRALSRWDNEGGAGPGGPDTVSAPDSARIAVPELTNAELVTLRIRVIALENMMISLLANASEGLRTHPKTSSNWLAKWQAISPHGPALPSML